MKTLKAIAKRKSIGGRITPPVLCHCTLGHEKAMWSSLFGRPIDAEIVESFQRGGKDCVIKLLV